jgi:hypothetical protein
MRTRIALATAIAVTSFIIFNFLSFTSPGASPHAMTHRTAPHPVPPPAPRNAAQHPAHPGHATAVPTKQHPYRRDRMAPDRRRGPAADPSLTGAGISFAAVLPASAIRSGGIADGTSGTRVDLAKMASRAPSQPPVPLTDANDTDTADWQCIRVAESGDEYNDPTRPSGAYGILDSTWLAYGYSGWPYQAPPSVQNALALELYNRYGWQPWSSRFSCGLG